MFWAPKGWREYYVSDGGDLTRIDPDVAPIQAFLGVVGMTGMTGYTGLLKFGRPAEGDTVFVSAAAGAVSSVVCQVAKIKGCRSGGHVRADLPIQCRGIPLRTRQSFQCDHQTTHHAGVYRLRPHG